MIPYIRAWSTCPALLIGEKHRRNDSLHLYFLLAFFRSWRGGKEKRYRFKTGFYPKIDSITNNIIVLVLVGDEARLYGYWTPNLNNLYTTRGRGSLGSQFDEDRGNPRKTTNLASFKGKSVERTLRPVVNRIRGRRILVYIYRCISGDKSIVVVAVYVLTGAS